MSEDQEVLIRVYEDILSKVVGDPNFTFNRSQRNLTLVENFLSILRLKTGYYGEDWFYNFFCFQVSRYYNLKTRFGKNQFQVNWFISKKALLAWGLNENRLYFAQTIKEKYRIKQKTKFEKSNMKDFYDQQRLRFQNKNQQFLYCQELDLFDSVNYICRLCVNNDKCQ